MIAPIRVALLGYGLAGAVFHAPLIAAVDGFELAAIVTRDAERRSRARREHPDAELLSSAGAVWERAADLDLVVVAAVNRAHVPLARSQTSSGELRSSASGCSRRARDLRSSSRVTIATSSSPSTAAIRGAWKTAPARP